MTQNKIKLISKVLQLAATSGITTVMLISFLIQSTTEPQKSWQKAVGEERSSKGKRKGSDDLHYVAYPSIIL